MDVPGLAISLAFSGAAFAGGGWWSLRRLSQLRYLLDTPTSKIRSAAQGYTELYGVLHELPQSHIRGPLTGKPCVWWRFKIEEYRNNGKKSSWSSVESGSCDAWLVLADATGECLINPQGAEVRPSTREVWTGSLRHPLRQQHTSLLMGLLTSGKRYRYSEERLHVGEPLYAIGDFRSSGAGQQGFDLNSAQGAVIREWKADFSGLLQRFDRDGSGQLEEAEWQLVRRAAGHEAEQRHLKEGLAPAQHALGKPVEAQPFILSSKGEDELARGFRWQALAGALICLAGALASAWLLNTQLLNAQL